MRREGMEIFMCDEVMEGLDGRGCIVNGLACIQFSHSVCGGCDMLCYIQILHTQYPD
jgi:hypothetical protein